jgi:hypothetical protein
MDFEEFEELQSALLIKAVGMKKNKGREYAGADNPDRLANFKRIGERLGLPPEKVAQVYLMKHTDAVETFITDLLLDRNPQFTASEPIEGRFVDVITYFTLLFGLVTERIENIDKANIEALCAKALEMRGSDSPLSDALATPPFPFHAPLPHVVREGITVKQTTVEGE